MCTIILRFSYISANNIYWFVHAATMTNLCQTVLKKETCISLLSIPICASVTCMLWHHISMQIYVYSPATHQEHQRQYWRKKVIFKSPKITLIYFFDLFQSTCFSGKLFHDNQTVQKLWEKFQMRLWWTAGMQKKDSDGMSQECEVQLHTHWVLQ